MKKYMVLFLMIFVYGSYAQTDIDEYYYQILLNEWLKDATEEEIKPHRIDDPSMVRSDAWNLSEEILKMQYNIDVESIKASRRTFRMGTSWHPFWLICTNVLPENEQVWILFPVRGGRFVSYKDKITSPDWKRKKLPEIRDNNTYTFLLRLSKLDKTYHKCHFLQESEGFSVFPNGIDSIMALSIAVTAAEKCYCTAMTPIAAKLMGNRKEHWLVYCFRTMTKDKQNDCYKHFTYRYNNGLTIWNVLDRDIPVFCNMNWDLPVPCRLGNNVATVLISRENGQVLFVD